jgi:excisionase family DNA binding protein
MKLLTIIEAARILSMSPSTLYSWRWRRKQFPFVKLGRALRVDEDELSKFISEKKTILEKWME